MRQTLQINESTMENQMWKTKDIKTKNGKYVVNGRTFITDGCGGIFEQMKTCNEFYCNKNGRTAKAAIVDNLNMEY